MKRCVVLVVLGLSCLNAWSAEDFRVFTDTQGRTIRGRIISYDAQKQEVAIERDNHKRASVPLSLLTESDQKFIKAWDLYKDFMNERAFIISVKRKKFDNDDKSQQDFNSSREVDNMGYEVRLENNSDTKFDKIKVEYCIFYEQEERDNGVVNREGVFCDTLDLDALLPKSRQDLLTKTVMIYKEELNSDWHYGSGAKNTQRGEILGIWLRASMNTPDGETVVREYTLPDTLPEKHRWTTASVNVGMN